MLCPMKALCHAQRTLVLCQTKVCVVPNEGKPRTSVDYGRPFRQQESPIVDRFHCLRETPAPFTSRSPDIATLGPSWIPDGQLGMFCDLPTKKKAQTFFFSQRRCSPNRQLVGQRRRWESNPLRPGCSRLPCRLAPASYRPLAKAGAEFQSFSLKVVVAVGPIKSGPSSDSTS